eukprot:TRINITY_DN4513_c0_g1_i3.p1 TRINITY_DN4513_c0_g1~~TRINITY_DN4513_c0_g1_i3.p1  ORF type:complete len:318 (+),score=51.32 TRINITY_DN4513_c0_g1_i3:599-1552(+)
MRLLYADLQYQMGRDSNMDALYSLFAYCKKQMGENVLLDSNQRRYLNSISEVNSESFDFIVHPIGTNFPKAFVPVTWLTLSCRVAYCIVSNLMSKGDLLQALHVVYTMILPHFPDDVHVLSTMVRIFLQIGDSGSALEFVSKMEKIILSTYRVGDLEELERRWKLRQVIPNTRGGGGGSSGGHDDENSDQVKRVLVDIFSDKAFILLTNDDYQSAGNFFSRILTIDPLNSEALSNYSLCLLYTGHLMDAIKLLEDTLVNPTLVISDPLIFNLCTLYDLAWANSSQKKEDLFLKMFPFLSDDFDVSVFKLNPTPDLSK